MNKQLFKELNEMGKETLQNLIEDAKDYAMYKGIAQRDLKLSKDARIHLPFCLIPCEFSKKWFDHVYTLQPWLNFVLHRISNSKEFLKECLLSTIESDDFTRKIFDIFEEVFDSQCEQTSLGLIRCDYLLKCDSEGKIDGIKQVENNTFAAGLGGISPLLKDLYQFVLEKLKWKDYGPHLPENESCIGLVQGLIRAFKSYDRMNAVILFVVEEATFNILDQRILEYKFSELFLEFDVEVLRCTFKNLRSNLELRDRILHVNGKEVAVVYFRVGYAPEHYEPEDWTTRLLIEQSRAVKCPSVGLHLAGTKKVQECLAQKEVLEKFIEPTMAKQLRRVFAFQCSLNTVHHSVITSAMNNPDMYVLKPEREGGGNNLYGFDLTKFLLKEQNEEIKSKSCILMERIQSPEVPNYIIRSDRIPEAGFVNSELGIFGAILGNSEEIFMNEAVGHLLRCKPVNTNEGGIASGAGALSYPYLV